MAKGQRQRQWPQRFRDVESEEYIDIEQGLDDDDDDEVDEDNVQPQRTAGSNNTDPLATGRTNTDPLATGRSNQGQSGAGQNVAHDIRHFFHKGDTHTHCNICDKAYSLKSSTTTLHNHLNSVHPLAYLEKLEENNWVVCAPLLKAAFQRGYTYNTLREALSQPGAEIDKLPPPPAPGANDKLPIGASHKVDHSANLPEYSVQGFHKLLVEFIISDDQAMYIVERPQFRRLLLFLRRDLRDLDIPRCIKTRELVLVCWRERFTQLKAELKRSVGAVSFTMDIWSANKLDSYLAVTAHWIGEESCDNRSGQLVMKAALIAFHCLPAAHTGKEIAKAFLQLIDRAGIPVNKIGHFTMDNASNNDKALSELATILSAEHKVEFDAKARRIRCFPHVMNICVQHIISSYASADFTDVPRTWGSAPRVLKKAEYVKALQDDPIIRGRETVQCVHNSGQRRRNFKQTIEAGNANQLFSKDSISVELPVVQLLHDVTTRWDSTYFMINRLRALRQAVDMWVGAPRNANLISNKMFPVHWEVLQDLEFILFVPAMAHHTMTSERVPLLGGALPAYEMFLDQWQTMLSSTTNAQFGPILAEGVAYGKRYHRLMRENNVYLLGMFVHPSIRFSWVERRWGNDISSAKATILETMQQYRMTHSIANAQTTPTTTRPAFMGLASLYGMEIAPPTLQAQGQLTIEEEFGLYVASTSQPDADVLAFWELERARFPTIYRIAMDFFPVQPSSVPCERVFSLSAETDTKKRNRLSPVTMELLQMTKFSLKQEQFHFVRKWSTSEFEMLPDFERKDLLGSVIQAGENIDQVMTEVLDAIASAEEDDNPEGPVNVF